MSEQGRDAVLTYTTQAMNTDFTLRLVSHDRDKAQSAAWACFEQLEHLEDKLSYFRQSSDVSRINHLAAGETLFISDVCYACLRKAAEAHALTCGLFDVTVGSRIEHQRQGEASPAPESTGRIALDPERPAVTCEVPGRVLDLGGIGKGFALDELVETLAAFEIGEALISAGASTQLAIGERTWPLRLGPVAQARTVDLKQAALSASGTAIQGAHIVDPTRQSGAEYAFSRVWVVTECAAFGDAFSTACMLMSEEELDGFATETPEVRALFAELPAGDIVAIKE